MDINKFVADIIKDQLTKAVQEALQELGIEATVVLEHPTEGTHGDYSTNVAMMGFKKVPGEWKSPMELAEEIVGTIKDKDTDKEGGELVDKIEVAAPGFINFWLTPNALLKELDHAQKAGDAYGAGKPDKTMVIDYSAPNIAKPFGIGHLRSTIIGQAIYNLYKFLGWKTIGDNHLGDWGTQFGTLLYQITTKKLDVNRLTIADLEGEYVEFNKMAVENPDLKEEARAWFKKLEDGDPESREIWEKLKEISLAEFNRIYKLLNVEIDYAYGESFYQNMFEQVIQGCVDKGIAMEDQGALIVDLSKNGMPPALIRKSDGASTYLTRDLATVKFRIEKWDPDAMVYETSSEQDLHFRQLFAIVELLGWSSSIQFLHVKHGLYLSPRGKKFSTRRGDTVHLEDVLKEAVERAGKLGKDKDTDTERGGELAKEVGIGAVKYFDLSHHPATNIVFEWEKMFALEGNSAPYLQYTYARTRSVSEKARGLKRDKDKDKKADRPLDSFNIPLNSEELAVLRHFYKFPVVIREAAENFSPNILANFLFELAQKYNSFYNKHRILSDNKTTAKSKAVDGRRESVFEFRLEITQVTGNILRTGLGLLGIQTPERM